jgi:hypothetical protein
MLIHISSTGSLVMLAPPKATPAQEALWYGDYGGALWIIAAAILAAHRSDRREPPAGPST